AGHGSRALQQEAVSRRGGGIRGVPAPLACAPAAAARALSGGIVLPAARSRGGCRRPLGGDCARQRGGADRRARVGARGRPLLPSRPLRRRRALLSGPAPTLRQTPP